MQTTQPDQDWAIGREEAIPRLLELHGSRLYHLSLKICGKPEEAEDLMQEVFLQAWRSWDQFRGESQPFVWLYTIARHACQRMHRKKVAEPDRLESLEELFPGTDTDLAVPPDRDAVGDQISREEQELVGEAISSLPPEFRMALVLKEIVGFSIDETAEILGINPQTVKTRVHRARLKVRKALEDGLAKTTAAENTYSLQVCLDLLNAKQDALDRGVEMPNADNIICDRCRSVFATLDYTGQVTRSIGEDLELPPELQSALLTAMANETAG